MPTFRARNQRALRNGNDDFIDEHRTHLRDLYQVYNDALKGGRIKFKHIQVIFKTGSILVGKNNDLKQCYLLDSVGDEQGDEQENEQGHKQGHKQKAGKYVTLRVFSWIYRDSMYGLSPQKLKLEAFSNDMAITNLKYFPLEWLPEAEGETLVPELVCRGRKWLDHVHNKHVLYEGKWNACTSIIYSSVNSCNVRLSSNSHGAG
jgi:hypothetical protein